MSARDNLIELFENGGPHHLFSIEEAVDIELAAYAHELAEKILAAQTNWTGNGDIAKATRDALIAAADLIDPEVQ